MEVRATRLQHVHRDTHLHHGVSVHDIDSTPIVNENPGEPDIEGGPKECWIHQQCISSRSWHNSGMIPPAPTDFLLGPVHILRHCWHNCVHLQCTPMQAPLVCWLGHKDHITLMSFSVISLRILSLPTGTSIAIVVSDTHLIDRFRSWRPLCRCIHWNCVCSSEG